MSRGAFWSEHKRMKKLSQKQPALSWLSQMMPWERFRPLLEEALRKEDSAGWDRVDAMILFKMLVVQKLFNLSDEDLECEIEDRRSFKDFIGLEATGMVPDPTIVATFRETLRKVGVMEELFDRFEQYLSLQGVQVEGGRVVGPELVHVSQKYQARDRRISREGVQLVEPVHANPGEVNEPFPIQGVDPD